MQIIIHAIAVRNKQYKTWDRSALIPANAGGKYIGQQQHKNHKKRTQKD
jgi:hypothetical protein